MSTSYEALLPFLLPECLLEYFDIARVESSNKEYLATYLEENNLPPAGYDGVKLESKGFLPETAIRDYPIRRRHVMLYIKRRRW